MSTVLQGVLPVRAAASFSAACQSSMTRAVITGFLYGRVRLMNCSRSLGSRR